MHSWGNMEQCLFHLGINIMCYRRLDINISLWAWIKYFLFILCGLIYQVIDYWHLWAEAGKQRGCLIKMKPLLFQYNFKALNMYKTEIICRSNALCTKNFFQVQELSIHIFFYCVWLLKNNQTLITHQIKNKCSANR